MELSEDLLSKVINEMKSRKQPEIYWDYDDTIDTKSIVKVLEHADEYGSALWYLQDDIWERNMDCIYELEIDFIKDCLETLSDEIEEEFGCNCIDYKKLANELRDNLIDYVSVGLDIKGLLRGTENLRITMYSNMDCMNSFWFESQGGLSYEESYLGAVIDMLELNPLKVKELLEKDGHTVYGEWPDLPLRIPYVDLAKFYDELLNQSCPAVNLTILGQANQYDLLKNGTKGKVIIPKGNRVGFYSSLQGGGSPFDTELLRDFEIDLDGHGETKYDHWGMEVDDPSNAYHLKNCYGTYDDIFSSEITYKTTEDATV